MAPDGVVIPAQHRFARPTPEADAAYDSAERALIALAVAQGRVAAATVALVAAPCRDSYQRNLANAQRAEREALHAYHAAHAVYLKVGR